MESVKQGICEDCHVVRANTMKCDDLRSKLEEIMIVMKKQLVPSSNMTVLLSLQNCGEWIVTLGTSDVSITWVRGNTKTNQYGSRTMVFFI